VKRSVLKYSFILLISPALVSCYGYTQVRIMKKVDLAQDREKAGEKNIAPPEQKNKLEKRYHTIYIKKYLARIKFSSPAAEINNRAVELSLEGRFKEAEILFKDLIGEERATAAVCNNLGVIYEIFGKKELAFAMYSRACILESGNSYFRSNLLSFEDSSEK